MSLQIPRENLSSIARGFKEEGYTNVQIGEITGWSENTVRRSLKEADHHEVPMIQAPTHQPSKTHFRVLEELHIKDKDVAVMSDIHLPTTRYDRVDEFVRKAIEAGIKTLIIAGDLFDQSKLNRHDSEWEEGRSFSEEKKEGNRIMRVFLDKFEEIIILRGNHDINFVRNNQWATSFEESMRMILNELTEDDHKRITIVDCDSCYVHTKQGMFLIAHTYQFSKIVGKVPSDLAMINKECIGVIGAHRHHYGIVNVPNGNLAVECGHFSDSSQLQWMKRYKNTHGKEAKGGGVFLFHKEKFSETVYLPLLTAMPQRIINKMIEDNK